MISFYKGREIVIGSRVRVYFNLHKKVFSVMAMEGTHKGLVVAHLQGVLIKSPTFVVNEKGRQRVLHEKRKNVHAYVDGVFAGTITCPPDGMGTEVSYNPYKKDHFYFKASGEKVEGGSLAIMYDKSVRMVG